MRVKLNNTYITDSTQEYQDGDEFLLTFQNRKYHTNEPIIYPRDLLRNLSTKFIGITGTNGKTTTAFIVSYILEKLGYKVGVQGTEGFFVNNQRISPKTLTTPPILTTIARAYESGVDFFVMEVSSHAISQHRIEGIEFAAKVFTNISQDHLDYHKNMQQYQAVKESFLADETLKIINKRYNISFNPTNAYLYPLKHTYPTQLKGEFNQENFQAACLCVSKLLDIDIDQIASLARDFAGVRGRMEEVSEGVFVDFAHTPDGMQKVLSSIQGHKVVVFGAGGDRDPSKRELMGKVADKYSDFIILTNDNPRCEDEMQIIHDIQQGITTTPFIVIPDRKTAILHALQMQKDYVFVLGKGDEQYIQKCDEKIAFSDREVIKELKGLS
ncbi:MAG: UDP-N-acetylmuramoyl-L-alanyl-D-glutamate--2,6-diaminopimelate ligase [Epsilonproteobacteria bacterium]|nr:UDP-N-acetylmuramoyl-L-alanyl-D-glutamate--2,6-diaminopimelate ligase [Campylobacterota bacterium]